MSKVPYKKLRSRCKGGLNDNSSFELRLTRASKRIVQGFPVLSIFVLLGIMSISIISPALPKEQQLSLFNPISWLGLPSLLSTSSDSAYAATYTETSGESSVSLTIGGAGEKEQVSAGRGVVAYRSHTVRVKADVVKDYGLTISGPANMTAPSGGTTINGIANKTGTEVGNSSTYDNTWGYGWGATTTSDANLTYRTLSTTGTNLLTVNGTNDKPALSNRAVDFTRKLVFAVKFGEEAVAGRYYANVTLSLTATPATLTTYSVTYDCKSGTGCPSNYSESLYDESKTYTIPTTIPTRSGYEFLGYSTTDGTTADADYAAGKTITLTQASPSKKLYAVWEVAGPSVTGFGGIKKMQDMTPSICNSASGSGQLYDTRDNSIYTVQKIGNQCWMTQNLVFDITQAINTMSVSNSDVASDWSWPATPARYTTGTGWTESNTAIAYITAPTLDSAYPGDGNGYRSVYGYYYSWCAATAGCKDENGNNPTTNVDAVSSICPKGWKLPKGGNNAENDFAKMAGIPNASTNNQWGSAIGISFSGYTLSVNGSSWPAAGNVSPGNGLRRSGAGGRYWSRTAINNISGAYYLSFGSNNFYPSSYTDRSYGCTVRCVAYSN